jgi:hypothetical protein
VSGGSHPSVTQEAAVEGLARQPDGTRGDRPAPRTFVAVEELAAHATSTPVTAAAADRATDGAPHGPGLIAARSSASKAVTASASTPGSNAWSLWGDPDT